MLKLVHTSSKGNTFSFCSHAVFSLSCVQLFVTPWTVAHQTPLSMGFPRQEYWKGSLSLLQRIFSAQESNQGLLYCRQILYQRSYQGTPTGACCSIIYCCLVKKSCSLWTLCDPKDCSAPGFPGLRYLPEFDQTHVH